MKSDSPIFIVGCGRSGTTLLRLILNRHSRIAIPEETWFFPQLVGELPELMRGNWGLRISKRILDLNKVHFPDLTIRALEEVLTKINPTDIPSIVASVNIEYMSRTGKNRWGDKTPGYVMHLPLIKKLYPEAKVIHMVRDGRDVIPSILKYWSVGPQTASLIETAFYWKKHVNSGVELGAKLFGVNYMELKYEDLAIDAESTIKKVCEFIGEEYQVEMLDHQLDENVHVPNWEWHNQTRKEITAMNVGKWKTKLTNYELSVIQVIGKDLLNHYGYQLGDAHSLKAYWDVFLFRLRKLAIDSFLEIKIKVYNFLIGRSLLRS